MAVERHIFICTDADCGANGGVELLRRMKDLVKARGLKPRVRITETKCLGECERGPAILVISCPDSQSPDPNSEISNPQSKIQNPKSAIVRWWFGVRAKDAERILEFMNCDG